MTMRHFQLGQKLKFINWRLHFIICSDERQCDAKMHLKMNELFISTDENLNELNSSINEACLT